MVKIIKAELVHTSIGEEIPIPITVSSIATSTITCDPPTSMITDIYIGCEFEVISCSADSSLNGKRYLIIDNTDDDLVIDTNLSGTLAPSDTARIVAYSAGPINTKTQLDTDTVIGVLPTVDYPDPEYEIERFYTSGGTREPHMLDYKEIKCTGSLPVTLQNGRILKYLMGNLYETGSDKAGGGGSTLDGATSRLATSFDVASATDYTTDDYIQVDTGTNSEIRKITNVSSNTITVDFPLDRAHDSGATCNEVESPFTHVMTIGESQLPSFTLERGVDLDTDWCTYYLGCVISKGELMGEEKGYLKAELDIIASRPFKNTNNAISSLTLLTDQAYMFYDANFTYWNTSFARILSFGLSVDNKIDPKTYWRQANGPYPMDMMTKNAEAELTTTVTVYDTSIWDELVAQNDVTCQIDFTRGSNDTAQIKCENCRLRSSPFNKAEEGPVEVEVTAIPKTTTLTFVDSIYHY